MAVLWGTPEVQPHPLPHHHHHHHHHHSSHFKALVKPHSETNPEVCYFLCEIVGYSWFWDIFGDMPKLNISTKYVVMNCQNQGMLIEMDGCWPKKLETWTEQILLGLWLVILHPATTYIWDRLGMLAWGRHLQVPRIDWTSEHAFSFLNRS